MSKPRNTQWTANKAVVLGVLHNRQLRRRWMANCAFVMLLVFSIGLWVIDKWLHAHPWMFILWWAGCMAWTIFVFAFAIYDIARVIREERDKLS